VADTEIDPITLAVVTNGLVDIANEMDATLEHAAFTPIISEAHDRASGIYSLAGEVVAQGDSGLPLFISTMQDAVQTAVRAISDWREGDIVCLNDPYTAGTHVMDMRFVTPFYVDGELAYFLANTGHWTDMGGMAPSSFCVAAREVQQEGVRIRPIHIYRDGALREDVVNLILDQVRVPDSARGDLQAQISGLQVGRMRLTDFLARHGRRTVEVCVQELRRRAEQAMRSHVSDIPDGTYEADSYLDNDGIGADPIKVHATVTVAGDTLTADFTGSSSFVRGPLNTSRPTTVAGVHIALKHLFPDVPTNAGAFEAVDIHVPEGTFLNATYPRAVSGSAEVSSVVADVVSRALAQALPDVVPAGSYFTMAAYTLSGIDPDTGNTYVLYSFNGGGNGASADGPGLSNIPLAIGIAQAPPVEVMERQYPIVYERYSLRAGSGGAGKHEGGRGIHHVIRLARGTATSSALMDNGDFAPWGAEGGSDGAMTELSYELGGEVFVPPLKTKVDGVEMSAGDRIVLKTPGGGGWGAAEAEVDRP
jgi:N-methylhydantoinase B